MSHDINPFMTNGFTHHYHLGKSTFIFRGIRSIFFLLFIHYENSLSKQYSPRWDATLCGVTSGAMLFAYVNLFSLLMFIFQDDTGFDMDMSHDEPDGESDGEKKTLM